MVADETRKVLEASAAIIGFEPLARKDPLLLGGKLAARAWEDTQAPTEATEVENETELSLNATYTYALQCLVCCSTNSRQAQANVSRKLG